MKSIPDQYYDWGIVDPNWGRKQHGGINRSHMVKQKNGSSLFVKSPEHEKKNWDNEPVAPQYFEELFRITKNQIIWGVNYFNQYFGPGRIIWDKCNEGADQSDCEIAYISTTSRVDIFRYMWRGMMQGKSIKQGYIQQGNKKLNEKIIHPTQKPVNLYIWLLQKYCSPGSTIFDSHLGSGSIGIACNKLDFELDSCEIDPEIYRKAKIRLNSHVQFEIQNPSLF